MALRVKNISQGYMSASGFHPIRSASDYDPTRLSGPEGKKAKKAARSKRAKAAAAKRKKGLKRAVSKRPKSRRNGSHEVTDLFLFITSDRDLMRQRVEPAYKNLATKFAKGVYNKTLANKLMMYTADDGAKRYAKQFAHPGDWNKIFTVQDRKEVAARLVEDFEAENSLGNYDNWLPKKYQKKQNPIPTSFIDAKIRRTPSGDIQVAIPIKGKGAGRVSVRSNPATIDGYLSGTSERIGASVNLTNGTGKVLGHGKITNITKNRPFGQRSYVSDSKVYARIVVDGVTYSGVGAGLSMLWRGKAVKKSNPHQTFMTRNDDGFDSVEWAFETHLKVKDKPQYKSLILYGNEDYPDKIEFFKKAMPSHNQKPDWTWVNN